MSSLKGAFDIMNVKDLSITTVLLSVLYFMAFSFYRGFSTFYGFPTSFITIGISEIVKFSVIALGILCTLVALLHVDYEKGKPPFWFYSFFFILASVLSYCTMAVYGGSDYLYENAKKDVLTQSLLLGFFSLASINSIATFVRNEFKIKNKMNGVMLFTSIAVLPSILGWAWAYLSDEPFFYSKKHDAYIIETYNGKFVLGRCRGNKASYINIEGVEGPVTPVSMKETQQLKTCFLIAANLKRSKKD